MQYGTPVRTASRLGRNIQVQLDLIEQLFHSSEEAAPTLLLVRDGQPGQAGVRRAEHTERNGRYEKWSGSRRLCSSR